MAPTGCASRGSEVRLLPSRGLVFLARTLDSLSACAASPRVQQIFIQVLWPQPSRIAAKAVSRLFRHSRWSKGLDPARDDVARNGLSAVGWQSLELNQHSLLSHRHEQRA